MTREVGHDEHQVAEFLLQMRTVGARLRLGQPAGPETQVASLEAPFVPHGLRRWIADELAVRYRMTLPFDPTWEVHRQRAAIAAMAEWARAQRFVPGRWYVAGHYAD